MAVDLTKSWLDAGAPQYRAMLNNLQGGILKSHGRNHVRLLVFQITAGPRAVRAWMADFARLHLTSARQQLEETRRFRVHQAPGTVFGNLFLTAQAYRAILGPDADLAALFPEPPDARPERRVDALWREGMEAAGKPAALDDPPLPSPYDRRQVHGMVLLADDDPDRLEQARREVEVRLSRVAKVLVTEVGTVLRNGRGEAIESFGYRDGLSQPLFLRQDLEAAGQSEGGELQPGSQEAPLELTLVADPLTRQPDAFGSYLVFRKLEQDVKAFREILTHLAMVVGHSNAELAGAMAVGRFEDGTPVALSSSPMDNATNDFDYSDSRSARKCPFHAHIRKMNPRGGSVREQGGTSDGPKEERSRRIVRRGIPYGGPVDPQSPPSSGLGLLFLCFQSNISRQFAFLQKIWADNPEFAIPSTGIDPLIGRFRQRLPSGSGPGQSWPIGWDGARGRLFRFRDFVRLQGGEFFFAPSIPFLLGR